MEAPTIKNVKDIPAYWKARMTKYGISVRSVAIAANVNLPYFYRVMHFQASPTLGYVDKIESAMTKILEDRQKEVEIVTASYTNQ